MLKSILKYFFAIVSVGLYGQAGLSTSPLRLFFGAGDEGTPQKVIISNPTDRQAEVGVFFSDWNYNDKGDTQIFDAGTLETDCSDYIRILPESFFVLAPHSQKEIEVFMVPPEYTSKESPVLTSLLFFQQLNPFETSESDLDGAALKVTVRIGVKIYYAHNPNAVPEIEIENFNLSNQVSGSTEAQLSLRNAGKIWVNGKIEWQLFNHNTGESLILDETKFYTLPGDLRIVSRKFPESINFGKYTLTAKLNYGDRSVVKIAELDFEL